MLSWYYLCMGWISRLAEPWAPRKGQVAKTMRTIVHEGDLKIQKLAIEVLWHSSMPNSQIHIACVSSHHMIQYLCFLGSREIPGSATVWNSSVEEINYVKHHQGVWSMSIDCATSVSANLHNWWLWSSLYTHDQQQATSLLYQLLATLYACGFNFPQADAVCYL